MPYACSMSWDNVTVVATNLFGKNRKSIGRPVDSTGLIEAASKAGPAPAGACAMAPAPIADITTVIATRLRIGELRTLNAGTWNRTPNTNPEVRTRNPEQLISGSSL